MKKARHSPALPLPDLVRDEWLNLNGEWQFAFDGEAAGLANGWKSGR